MASRESVTVQFGADVTQFQQGIARMEHLSDQFEHGLEHRFLGARHVIGALFVGAGLGSGLEGLADKIAEAVTGGTKEGFKEAEKAQDEFAAKFEETLEKHMGGAALLSHLKGQLEKAQDDASRPRATARFREGSLLNTIGNQFGTFGAETAADAQKRQAEGAKKVLELKEKIGEEEKRQSAAMEAITDEARKGAAVGMNDEEKLLKLRGEREETVKRIAQAQADIRHGTGEQKETDRLILAYQKQTTEIAEAENKIRENGLKEQKKIRDEIATNDTEYQTKVNAIAAAREREKEALKEGNALLKERQQELATAKDDMFLPGLSQLAKSGGPGSSLATEAERYERMATERSGSAPNESRRFSERALSLRSQLSGKIKSEESDPFKGMERAITESEKHLAKIEDSLKPIGLRSK